MPATYFRHGIPTVLMLHIGWAELGRLRRENRGNLIIAGHVGGDSMGFHAVSHGPSSTCRTFLVRPATVNGFSMTGMPAYSTP